MGTTTRWPPRWSSRELTQARRLCICFTYAFSFVVLLLLLLELKHPRLPHFLISAPFPSPCPQCSSSPPATLKALPAEVKYMWYSPHSGFSNQVMELKNALAFAVLLNRTLIVPPVLDHHALALGSCPKSRLLHKANDLRALAWAEFSALVMKARYVSIADIIDLSGISPKLVKTIDLRTFAALWCGVDVSPACSGPYCTALVKRSIPAWGSLEDCGAVLSQASPQPACCVRGVQDDCTTTLWTSGSTEHAERRLIEDYLKGSSGRVKNFKDVVTSLGSGSLGLHSTVLAFGSLFSMSYKGVQTHVDFTVPSGNDALDAVLEASKHLRFSAYIMEAGKRFAREFIGQPFFCAQLRLLDGQFKNQWEKNFLRLEEKLERVRRQVSRKKQKVVVFVMTDLPAEEWQDTFLGRLASNHTDYKLCTLSAKTGLVITTARNIIAEEIGLRSGYLPLEPSREEMAGRLKPRFVPDILVNIQEVVCSCASLGYFGTSGSTLANAISDMRGAGVCII